MDFKSFDKFIVGHRKVLEFPTVESFMGVRDEIAEAVDGDWSCLILRFKNDGHLNLDGAFEGCNVKFAPTIEILEDTEVSMSRMFQNSNLMIATFPFITDRVLDSYFDDNFSFKLTDNKKANISGAIFETKTWKEVYRSFCKTLINKFQKDLSPDNVENLINKFADKSELYLTWNVTKDRGTILTFEINLRLLKMRVLSDVDEENVIKVLHSYEYNSIDEFEKAIEAMDINSL